nr:MAG TPA: hypothetical protein [Podoviridae sp. ctgx11]
MKTLQKQIFDNGEVKSMFSQEDFPANHSVLQEREREQKITATSGRTCYEQYGKFSPLGLLVKTLLESSQWYSPARRLIWVAKPLYLKRITEQERSSSTQSMEYVKVLSRRDIQSRRLLFRLVPLARHTEETECGLLQDLTPTPIASDAQGGAVKLTKGTRLRNGQVFSATLKDLAASKMLPTPKAQEARGNCSVNRNKFNLTDKIAELASQTSRTSQLNPLFVAEMMGYPLEWLTLPFLSQSGGAKALKR